MFGEGVRLMCLFFFCLKMLCLSGFSILVWIFMVLKGWVMGLWEKDIDSLIMYDCILLWLIFGFVVIGFIMVILVLMFIG